MVTVAAMTGNGRDDHLLAEDLLLLLLDDESGKLRGTGYLDAALGGALLAELALAERVEVRKDGRWSAARVEVVGEPLPVGTDPELVAALTVAAEKPRRAQDLVGRLGKGRRDALVARLVDRGIVAEQRDRVWGLFPRTRWPAVDSSHERGVREGLDRALVHGLDPDPRTAVLVGLLAAVDEAHQVVRHDGVRAREVKRRAEELAADGTWATAAVRDAVQAAQAATMAAVTATTIAATSAATS